MDIYTLYTNYLLRSYWAMVMEDINAYTHAVNQLVRIERMYGDPDQDNFYHYRVMIKNMFVNMGGKWFKK